ncbi:MAG: sialidase family protein [Planctomycetota bacterium]|nr:sialidase family protein [Planctomycetota bacterium]
MNEARPVRVWLCLVAGLVTSIASIAVSAEPEVFQADVFTSGIGGYHTYRIPSVITTNKGTLLVFCEGRKTSSSDDGNNDMLAKRSDDRGKTWQATQLIHDEGGDAIITIGNACAVVDRTTGTVWLMMTRKNDRVLITHSEDDGRSWKSPTDITTQVKQPAWGWYATGPGVGIQLQHGPSKGRLVIPCDHRKTKDRRGPSSSHVVFSDDHGKTWQLGGFVGDHTNECQVVQLSEGTLMLNARNHYGRSGNRPELAKRRLISLSRDGGVTWSKPQVDESLIEPQCQASLVQYPRPDGEGSDWLLFSNPASRTAREKMTVRLSKDGGKSWPVAGQLHAGSSAYSCLTVLPDGRIGIVYERERYSKITFAAFTLEWLLRERK